MQPHEIIITKMSKREKDAMERVHLGGISVLVRKPGTTPKVVDLLFKRGLIAEDRTRCKNDYEIGRGVVTPLGELVGRSIALERLNALRS